MKRLLLLALSLTTACGSKAAARGQDPVITTAAHVALAAVNRAATKDCWAACQPTERCDHSSGLCVHIPCGGDCPVDEHCEIRGDQEQCVATAWDRASAGARGPAPSTPGSSQAPPAASSESSSERSVEPADACRGLCLAGEQCVLEGGIADCKPSRIP